MSSLLIHHARCVATIDHADPTQATELADASIYIRDHRIAYISPAAQVPPEALQLAERA